MRDIRLTYTTVSAEVSMGVPVTKLMTVAA